MSENHINLNLDACEERFHLFKSHFPSMELNSYYKFDTDVSAEQNLSLLAEYALDPNVTVAYMCIYKPIFLDVVSRWICYEDVNKCVDIVSAIGRIITFCPEAKSLSEVFFEKYSDHLNLTLQAHKSQTEQTLHKILLAYYRLLHEDRDRFMKYLKPDVLYLLLNCTFSNQSIKFLAAKVLTIYLNMAEMAANELIDKYAPFTSSLIAPYEGGSDADYIFLELNEAKRFSKVSALSLGCETLPNDVSRKSYYIKQDELSKFVVSVQNILIPKVFNRGQMTTGDCEDGLVPTDKSVLAMRKLATCIQLSKPVLLYGEAGSGKTFLIEELSKIMGCHDAMVKIHLGEQTDAKLLLGTYTSGEIPGTFEWRSGVLTTAVREGRWVLIEDIDKAPTEVLSVLLTLLEKSELTIPSRGETIKAINGFQLIATIRTSEDKQRKQDEKGNLPDLIGMRLWETVHLDEPEEDDLKRILCSKYPILKNLIPRFIKTYNSVKDIYSHPQFISLNRGVHPRVITIRDLVKLCQRVESLFLENDVVNADQLIKTTVYDNIFAEAADCFASAISEVKILEPLIQAIGTSLEISASRVSLFLAKHVPNFHSSDDKVQIGRATLHKNRAITQKKSSNELSFARTNHSLRLMEQIGVAIQMTEPVLLVGETGTGKTTVVQQVAKLMNKKLTVINVSQQTESGDLLGGYKPINSKSRAVPLLEEFEELFALTFSMRKNERFYKMLHKCFNKNQWKNVTKLWTEAHKMAKKTLGSTEDESETKKKKRRLDSHTKKLLLDRWNDFYEMVKKFEIQSSSVENSFVFNFVEGSMVKAVRNGDWLLLDEVNLASPDTLESISDLLAEPSSRSLLLSEKGEAEPIKAHPDFRIFACMNPATDVGKRDLPTGIRSRFTEIYVHSPDRDITDLLSIIDKYIGKFSVSDEWVGNDIAELYLEAKRLANSNKIVDGSNQKPHFSIRTLTRTLIYVTDIVGIYGLRRSLYESFCMSFLTLLDENSEQILKPLIEKYTLGRLKNAKSVMSQSPPCPGPDYVNFKHYWMKKGPNELIEQPQYIITPFVEKNMLNLVRATSGRRFPVLIQGPTSAGKTSMIKYLADITGHEFVRINNHEHTDLQEYLGTYIADDTGKLAFREGVLVEALRKGHWIVLDELNLAPTDILEALNRLLDDNRELFIPETQEVVHPHPDFMLFATQNPPGIYGGRKVLSRAFRNRFLELHFDDIPQDELEIILRERCKIAPSYAKKIVEVYRELSVQRSANRIFEQKNGFATLRDLFRWALREAVGYEQLAANGYMLLAERCRSLEEKETVKIVLEKIMKVKLNMDEYYANLENKQLMNVQSPVVWTKAMRRLSVLVSSCLQNNEPILLVGETGCGKTTICQLICEFMGHKLISINAHQNTETGDILGAQRPIRNRSEMQGKLSELLRKILNLYDYDEYSLDQLLNLYDNLDDSGISDDMKREVQHLRDNLNVLFEWNDGPLVQALKQGEFFLLDEISLADDSVLERLNSVLEPERSLLLAEKGSIDSFVTAKDGFQFFATMNPGGDYGKKELSPALRNRFTEIWVPSMEDFDDVHLIVSAKLTPELKKLADPIVQFSEWFGRRMGGGSTNNGVISLRDILGWVEFIVVSYPKLLNCNAVLLQGALMVFIDALGTNNTAHLAENQHGLAAEKIKCVQKLASLVKDDLLKYFNEKPYLTLSQKTVRIGMFDIERKNGCKSTPSFNLDAPTTAANLMRVVRAMQVKKPILLEGSPGVGKTSLISALAQCTGNKLTRINLSEQTDLIDLFGSDAPGEKTGEFVWRDAPFLRAMQLGEWVLLDEMNLASQSVLEGLNACLDHRGEAYIPELDRSFVRHKDFVVFAAQNPQYQGGGRKGLPKSFVNRFSVVYIDMLTPDDLFLIATHLYPEIEPATCTKMISVISALEDEVTNKKLWGSSGGPWEFNLRDTLRWLKLLNSNSICEDMQAFDFLNIVLKQRFRSELDRQKAQELIIRIFGEFKEKDNLFQLGPNYVQVNGEISLRNTILKYSSSPNLVPLQCNFSIYESLLRCVNYNWPLILVGPTNAGKTDIIRFMSNIVGSKVLEFSMNSDVDSMDILGGYEQVDLNRKLSQAINRLFPILRELLAVNMISSGENHDAILAAMNLFYFISTTSVNKSNLQELQGLLEEFILFRNDDEIQIIAEEIKKLSVSMRSATSVSFEWFDGLLLNAVEEGHWLVLDNANLCSPSVLDRLNSLLETDGSLIINECSYEDGRPRIVTPHPGFRLFLTMDPKYGELSRAMRNRSIEIYVNDLKTRSSTFDRRVLGVECENREEQSLNDNMKNLSICSGSSSKPLSTYLPSDNSLLTQFGKLHDTIALTEEDIDSSVFGILSLRATSLIDRWNSNVQLLSPFFEEETVITDMTSFFTFLKSTKTLEKLQHVYGTLTLVGSKFISNRTDYANNQCILPTLNEYILTTLTRYFPEIRSSESIYLFLALDLLRRCISGLEITETRAKHGKVDSLSYLELSAAIKSGRKIKNVPKIPIFDILSQLNEQVINQLPSYSLFISPKVWKCYFDLFTLWMGAYKTSATRNEAKLRVYQELFEKWVSSSKDYLENWAPLSQVIDEFGTSLSLTTGNSMSIIWEEFRSIYPTSKELWLNYDRIVSVAEKFDRVSRKQYSDSYDFITDLRRVFFNLTENVLKGANHDFEPIVSKLEAGIEQLETISSGFLHERKHFFFDEFDGIMRMIFHSDYDLKEEINRIASHSSISTEKLIKLYSNSYSYPPVFDILWVKRDNEFESQTSSIFNSSLLEQLVIKLNSFESFTGSQMNQAFDDAQILLYHLLRSSNYVLRDQCELFKLLLKDWYNQIVSVHIGAENHNIEDVLSSVEGSKNSSFKRVHNEYLSPAIRMIEQTQASSVLGEAWILFCLGIIELFVPSAPYDPAVHDYVLFDHFSMQKTLAEKLVRSWKCCRHVLSGDNQLTAESLMATVTELDAPKKPRVYRPQETIDPLFDEWSSFTMSSVGSKPVQRLAELLGTFDEKAVNQATLFQQNSSQFLDRLANNYKVYSDLNDIFAGCVLGMKFGFDLLVDSKLNQLKSVSLSPLWSVDISILTSPQEINCAFRELSQYFKKKSSEALVVENVMIFFLRLFKFHGLSSQLRETFNTILQSLYYRWSLRRIQQEQEKQERGSVYKFKDNSDDVMSDFKEMFPDYEEVLLLDDGEEVKSSEESLTDVYAQLSEVYVSTFLENDKEELNGLVKEGSRVTTQLMQAGVDFKSQNMDSSKLTSVISQLLCDIQQYNEPKDDKSLNLYRDSSITETKKAVLIIEKLMNSVDRLLKQWPEHATLKELFRVCGELLNYPSSTPIARLLQKVEQIYTFATEWEKYASSEVSVAVHIKAITELIISWRKLELLTWSSLFDYEEKSLRKGVGKWWFHLFESIIVSATDQNGNENAHETDAQKITKSVGSLNLFMSKCTYAEFSSRLELIKAFSKHVELIHGENSSVLHGLCNVITYYEQFHDMIETYIKNGRKKLEKEVSEVILLASWKDVNIDALKQSSRKSHNSLYKLVRKYRDMLSQDVTIIIESGIPLADKVNLSFDLNAIPNFKSIDIQRAENEASMIPSWNSRPKMLQKVGIIERNMAVYGAKIEKQEQPDFYAFAREVLEEATRLRQETPGTLTKENKKMLASLKSQKAKTLNDTLKELRRMGLKCNFREDIRKVQVTVTSILGSSQSFKGCDLENIDAYYFRVLDLIPRLRNAASQPADDAPLGAIERGLAVFEHLNYMLVTSRPALYTLAHNYKRLDDLRLKLEEIALSTEILKLKTIKINHSVFAHICKWLPELIDYVANSLKLSARELKKEVDLTFLFNAKNTILDFKSASEAFETKKRSIITVYEEFEVFLNNFLNTLSHDNGELSFMYNSISTWISVYYNAITTVNDEIKEGSLEVMDMMFRKISTSIMLSVQKLLEEQREVITEEDDHWLVDSHGRVMNMIKKCNSSRVVSNVAEVVNSFNSNSFEADAFSISALTAFTLPLINQYFALLTNVINKSKLHYSSLSHGTFVLASILFNLSKDGFCSPEVPNEEVDDNNLHDGTGLGDGEGAQNNSKDVEEDENLTENAQQPNKDQNEKKDDADNENDDAVDMEGDMAGELEDASDMEDDEENEDEEENSMEEQIDDLDDDDPNAIDEKMWNEEASDDSKEKTSDEMPQNSMTDEMQASEEQEKEQKSEQKNEEDNNQKEESLDEESKPSETSNEEGDEEGDEEEDEEEDVGGQDDEVKNEENNELEENVPEVETMDLHDDLNLDSGEDDNPLNDDSNEETNDDLDVDIDMDDDDKIENEEHSPQEESEGEEQLDEQNMDSDREEIENGDEGTEDHDGEEQENSDKNEADSDPEIVQDDTANDTKEAGGEDNTENAEGLDGVEDMVDNDEMDLDSAVNQKSGAKGEGADSTNSEEQRDIGSSGNAQDQQQQSEDTEYNEASREEAKESLKQLGDSLKEFHRRREEIKEARTEENSEYNEGVNERPDEFEHVDGANAETDTQALGSANKDQVTSIDEEKAIDDEIPDAATDTETDKDGAEDEAKQANLEEDIEMNEDEAIVTEDQTTDDNNGKSRGAFIGERSQLDEKDSFFSKGSLESEEDELDELMDNIDRVVKIEESSLLPPRSIDEARKLWKKSEMKIVELASGLSEQLRLILEPTQATKLRGDYKTGKRLNMKRIIPYIASQFRKDKIWLRRTKPSKRQYQIMIAVDDSKSMSESKSVDLAFQSICLVSKALTQLESGDLSIVKFGETIREVHHFDQQFSTESGAKIFQWFDFQETKTDVKKLVAESIKIFDFARATSNNDLWQLEIIISDGVCEDHETIQRLVRRARENKIMLVFVIVDGINSNESIMDMSQVKYVSDQTGNMQLKVEKYLDTFPFEFYVVVHDISELPEMLSLILRQYFSELASV